MTLGRRDQTVIELAPDDDGLGTAHGTTEDDHGLSAPGPSAARVYDSAPQRAVPRLCADSPLLDSPGESTRIEGRTFDAIPR